MFVSTLSILWWAQIYLTFPGVSNWELSIKQGGNQVKNALLTAQGCIFCASVFCLTRCPIPKLFNLKWYETQTICQKRHFRGWTHWMFAISAIQMAWFWSVKSKHVGCLFLVDVDWLVNSTLDYSVFVLFWKSQIWSEIGFEERNWLMFRKLRYVVQTPKNLPFNGDSSCGYSKMVKDTRNVRNTQMH